MDIFDIKIRPPNIIMGRELCDRTTNNVGQQFKILNMNGEDLDSFKWKDNPGYFVGAILQIVKVKAMTELVIRSKNCPSAGWTYIHDCSEWMLEVL